jgi:hypothetical protein
MGAKMKGLLIRGKNFDSTWDKISPYVNYAQRVSDYPGQEQKLFQTAQKALYSFICSLCNRGWLKVGLHTKMLAHDLENERGGEVESSQKERLDEAISQALIQFKDSKELNQQLIIDRTNAIYETAYSFMSQNVDPGFIFWAKCCPKWCC